MPGEWDDELSSLGPEETFGPFRDARDESDEDDIRTELDNDVVDDDTVREDDNGLFRNRKKNSSELDPADIFRTTTKILSDTLVVVREYLGRKGDTADEYKQVPVKVPTGGQRKKSVVLDDLERIRDAARNYDND